MSTLEKQVKLVFNGINGASGDYLVPPMTAKDLSAVACSEPPPENWHLRELKWWREYTTQHHLSPVEGVDPKNLAEAGWGVIFAYDADPAIREALRPLLDHRHEQATRQHEHYYKEYTGLDGYRYGKPGESAESKHSFLARHGAGLVGPADPNKVPYYLLIVGSPTKIPFRFQYQLDIIYAVGRLDLDEPEDYERYANSIIEAESGEAGAPRKAAFFGARNPNDIATQLSHDHLIRPLADFVSKEHSDWSVEAVLAEEATKARLLHLLGGEETPALLFTASHGIGFPKDHPRQLAHQGALLCQDWSGPEAGRGKVSREVYLAADDITDSARLLGLVAFHFACYSAGTPELESFAKQALRERTAIAPRDFVARLPQRLLRQGALAVVGHVDIAWSYSFHWPQGGNQLKVYEGTLKRLLEGHPVGSALEHFNQRYAELSCGLSDALQEIEWGADPDHPKLARLWTAYTDARNFVLLGDPAVRLRYEVLSDVVNRGSKT